MESAIDTVSTMGAVTSNVVGARTLLWDSFKWGQSVLFQVTTSRLIPSCTVRLLARPMSNTQSLKAITQCDWCREFMTVREERRHLQVCPKKQKGKKKWLLKKSGPQIGWPSLLLITTSLEPSSPTVGSSTQLAPQPTSSSTQPRSTHTLSSLQQCSDMKRRVFGVSIVERVSISTTGIFTRPSATHRDCLFISNWWSWLKGIWCTTSSLYRIQYILYCTGLWSKIRIRWTVKMCFRRTAGCVLHFLYERK